MGFHRIATDLVIFGTVMLIASLVPLFRFYREAVGLGYHRRWLMFIGLVATLLAGYVHFYLYLIKNRALFEANPAPRLAISLVYFLGAVFVLFIVDFFRRLVWGSRRYERAVLDNTEDAVVLLDASGRVSYLNPSAADLVSALVGGADPAGCDLARRLPPRLKEVADIVSQGLGGRRRKAEMDIDAGGIRGSFVVEGIPIRLTDRRGANGRHLMLVIRDITARRKLEQAMADMNTRLAEQVAERTADLNAALDDLKREHADLIERRESLLKALDDIRTKDRRLAESERRFRSFTEQSPDIVFAADADGKMTYVSPRCGRYGFSVDDIQGRDFTEFIHPEDRERVAAERGRAFRDGVEVPSVFRLIAKDGSVHWIQETNRIQYGEDGRPTGVIGVLRDVTEGRKLEERARELDALKNRFIRVVSHQFRTPLNAIRWNLETLLSGDLGPLKKEQKDFIRLTYEANKRVIDRVGDVLAALDIEEGRMVFDKEAVQIESLAKSVASEFKARAKTKGIRLECEWPPERLPSVEADPEKVRDVMAKMLENAVIYTGGGGRVGVSVRASDGHVRFEVADSGIGIPAAEQKRVFGRFFRASNAALIETDASGVSLNVARHYIEGHGGRMGFESEEGKGSVFWFELPVKAGGNRVTK